MHLYESIFIINANQTDEEIANVIKKMQDVVAKQGGEMIKFEDWGKKKLAYEVKRERKGTYVYFYFRAPNITVGELERSYRLEDSIIKFLTVHLKKELVPPRPLETSSEEFAGGRI